MDSPTPPNTPYQSDIDPPEPSKDERIELAHAAWKDPNNTFSLNKIARQHDIWPSTLQYRITHGPSRQDRANRQQRLSPEEETALAQFIYRLQAWGWPGTVDYIKATAQELCYAKGDIKALGINWTQKFLRRHPDIKTKYVPPLDEERAAAQDPEILSDWFHLFRKTLDECEVLDEDIYNMDEKGFMLGVIGKVKVMISRHEKKQYMTQYGNREWVSIIEAVSATGKVIRPFIIFKGVNQQKAWHDAYPEASIACSLNGWTDNEIGLGWLQFFEKESAKTQQGQYRLLILDGYASHITSAVIQYCLDHKIILLCLPPHTMHVLQPLDVGLFAPLATAYKANIRSITRLGASYSVDKVDFLEQYQKARASAFSILNIRKAFEKTGLLPYNPDRILDFFPTTPSSTPPKSKSQAEQYSVTIQPATPRRGTLSYSGPDGSHEKLLTPATTLQVEQMMKRALQGKDVEARLRKISKAAKLAMAEVTIQERTNADLLELHQRKEKKANRSKGHYGNAKILNQELLLRRLADKEWNKEWIAMRVLGPIIFEESRAAKKRYQTAIATLTSLLPSPQKPSQPAPPTKTISQSEHAPLRVLKKIIRLPVRVTTQELKDGRWSMKAGGGTLQGQKVEDEAEQCQALGRGQRVRKPRKAAWLM